MKIPWKGLTILSILLGAIYLNYPTINYYILENKGGSAEILKNKLDEVKVLHTELSSVKLALGQPKQNRILLIMEEGQPFPTQSSMVQNIIGTNFTYSKEENSHYLKLNPSAGEDVFISDVARELNDLHTNNQKIKEIKLNERADTIIFLPEEGKRLTTVVEPIKSMLGDNYDWSYDEENQRYLSQYQSTDKLINLGLDLQGGMYLDVGVRLEDLVDKRLKGLVQDLEGHLINQSVNYENVVRVLGKNEVSLTLEAGETFTFSEDFLVRFQEDYDIPKTENGYTFTLKEDRLLTLKKNAIDQALETIRNRIDSLGVKEPSIQRQGEDSILIQLPGIEDPAQARKVISFAAVLEFMLVAQNGDPNSLKPGEALYFQDIRDPQTKELIRQETLVLEDKILLTGDKISDANVTYGQMSEAQVSISFNSTGAQAFGEITEKNVNRQLAIVLDGKVQSYPVLREAIYGGRAQISGGFTESEAKALAIALRSGALPAKLEIHEERTVGPSLGEDSIAAGIRALAIGIVIVIIFMLIYYKLSGVFAVMALIFNLLLIIGTLVLAEATLTLPGMAGLILTIGMAVDANVLIFERIREEMSRGNLVRKAILIGFQRATITILDSNITTVLAAIILFQFGTGPVKGFAVTLIIGIIASMFTSIVVGRFLFEVVYLKRKNLTAISI